MTTPGSHTKMLSDALAFLRRLRDEFQSTNTLCGRTQREGEDLIQRLAMSRPIGADEAFSRLLGDIRSELAKSARGYYLTPKDMLLLTEMLSDENEVSK